MPSEVNFKLFDTRAQRASPQGPPKPTCEGTMLSFELVPGQGRTRDERGKWLPTPEKIRVFLDTGYFFELNGDIVRQVISKIDAETVMARLKGQIDYKGEET